MAAAAKISTIIFQPNKPPSDPLNGEIWPFLAVPQRIIRDTLHPKTPPDTKILKTVYTELN